MDKSKVLTPQQIKAIAFDSELWGFSGWDSNDPFWDACVSFAYLVLAASKTNQIQE